MKESTHFIGVTCVEPLVGSHRNPVSVLAKSHLLHGFKGSTADVSGDHRQAARMNAGQHDGQIALEPPPVVFMTKGCKFASKRCQSQVQHGVPHSFVLHHGTVFL